jgi:hypothetical protein
LLVTLRKAVSFFHCGLVLGGLPTGEYHSFLIDFLRWKNILGKVYLTAAVHLASAAHLASGKAG